MSPHKPTWVQAITKEPVVLIPANPRPTRPVTLAAIIAALLAASGCAHSVRPDRYTPERCWEVRDRATTAAAVRTGSGYVATGLAAGGALAEALADSQPATIALAVAAVVAGAVGLSADSVEKSSSSEWGEACAMPVPVTP